MSQQQIVPPPLPSLSSLLTPTRRAQLLHQSSAASSALRRSSSESVDADSPLALSSRRRAELLDSARKHRAEVERDQQQQSGSMMFVPSPMAPAASRRKESSLPPRPSEPPTESFSETWNRFLQEECIVSAEENGDDGDVEIPSMRGAFCELQNLITRRQQFKSKVQQSGARSPQQEQQQQQQQGGSLVLKEAANIARQASKLRADITQTKQGPLAELERRCSDLDRAVEDCKSRTVTVEFNTEQLERRQLISRYRTDIRLLKQELATRPAACEVAAFKQQYRAQVEHLSGELKKVEEEQLLQNDPAELQRALASAQSELDSLAVELPALQEQHAALATLASQQRDEVRSWTERERPRHEDYIRKLELERDELRARAVSQGLLLSPQKKGNGDDHDADDDEFSACGSPRSVAGGDDDADGENNADPTGGVAVISDKKKRLPTVVEVQVVDVEGGSVDVAETMRHRAPRLRVKFVEGGCSEGGAANAAAASSSSAAAAAAAAAGGDGEEGGGGSASALGAVISTLTDIYAPPLATYENNETNRSKEKPHSLTVRIFSSLSYLLFKGDSWVEKGKREVRKEGEVLV